MSFWCQVSAALAATAVGKTGVSFVTERLNGEEYLIGSSEGTVTVDDTERIGCVYPQPIPHAKHLRVAALLFPQVAQCAKHSTS